MLWLNSKRLKFCQLSQFVEINISVVLYVKTCVDSELQSLVPFIHGELC